VKRIEIAAHGVTVLQSGPRLLPQVVKAATRHHQCFGTHGSHSLLWELPPSAAAAVAAVDGDAQGNATPGGVNAEATAAMLAAAERCQARVLPPSGTPKDVLMAVLSVLDLGDDATALPVERVAEAVGHSLFETGSCVFVDFHPRSVLARSAGEPGEAPPCGRMQLRLLHHAQDAAWMHTLLTSEAWTVNIAAMSNITDVAAAAKYIHDRPYVQFRDFGVGVWALCVGEALEPQGTCGLICRPEFGGSTLDLGFALLPSGTGRGYASQASHFVLSLAYWVLAEDRVAAVTRASNGAAQKLLQRVGFPEEPTRRSEGWGVEQFWYDIPLAPMVAGSAIAA
jgi:ribosomal protein S18 acetylase RimI-like enzyme